MSDEEAKAEEEEVVAEDEALSNLDQAMIRFPRNEGEGEVEYAKRMQQIANFIPTLWQKGQSGNPLGPRRKFKNFKSAIEDALTEGVNVRWKDGEIENVSRVSRQDLFMRNVVDMLVYGEIQVPDYKGRHKERKEGVEAEGRMLHLSGKDWADYALKFMRYAAPPAPVEKNTEVTQVVFDLGTFMPKEVKKTIIRQKIGTDAIKFEVEDQDVIDGEVVDGGDDGQDQ